jgi:hypothetical protein
MLSNEIADNGVKDRVTACRKRIREKRVMFKAQANVGIKEVFPEAQPSLSESSNRPTATVQTNRSFFELAEQTEEQEVGIT